MKVILHIDSHIDRKRKYIYKFRSILLNSLIFVHIGLEKEWFSGTKAEIILPPLCFNKSSLVIIIISDPISGFIWATIKALVQESL